MIVNWHRPDTLGGSTGHGAQIGPAEYKAPNLRHAERLAHTGSVSIMCRQASDHRRHMATRRTFAIVLLVLAAVAAVVSMRGK